jgi:hypothetical protein
MVRGEILDSFGDILRLSRSLHTPLLYSFFVELETLFLSSLSHTERSVVQHVLMYGT